MSKSFRSFCRSINNCRAGRKVTTRKRSNFERGGEDRFPEITTWAAAFVIPRQNNVTIFESFFAFRNRTCRSFYRWHVVAFFFPLWIPSSEEVPCSPVSAPRRNVQSEIGAVGSRSAQTSIKLCRRSVLSIVQKWLACCRWGDSIECGVWIVPSGV